MDKDHFILRNGIRCAGSHIIVDMYGAQYLSDMDLMRSAMIRAVEAAEATLLHIHLHHFEPNGGISGVAVLAESHISVHTWPEHSYAAFDIFMCGEAKPLAAVRILCDVFVPKRKDVEEILRGSNLYQSMV